MKLAQPPSHTAPWMPALDNLQSALSLIDQCLASESDKVKQLNSQFAVDKLLLKHATPFAWSAEPTRACLAAMRSIPTDTLLDAGNVDTSAAWWRFEEPLPIQTVNGAGYASILAGHSYPAKDFETTGIRALCIGWIYQEVERVVIPAGSPFGAFEQILDGGMPVNRALAISTWIDDPLKQFSGVIPSQTLLWHEGETFAQMMTRTDAYHQAVYGPGGKWEHEPQIGHVAFMTASDGICRFILAGLAWLNQKVLVESHGHVERHARKRFERTVGRPLDSVRVVSLRRVERAKHDGEPGEHREFTCRWTVDGHFRNQACGLKHADRRLTWVSPYIKGPEDKELRVPQRKVYVVNR